MLLVLSACPALAQKDAAEKVQEGNVNNWVEYYRKQRETAPQSGDGRAAQKQEIKDEKQATGRTPKGSDERKE